MTHTYNEELELAIYALKKCIETNAPAHVINCARRCVIEIIEAKIFLGVSYAKQIQHEELDIEEFKRIAGLFRKR